MRKPLPWASILDWGWILAVTLASSLLLYSGWREMSPYDSPDILAHQGNAIELIRKGIIPYRGQGLSYSGWGPPGTSFLMVPGVLLMSDPRLAEVPGAVLLHFGTLLFLFLIVRDLFGRGPAWAAVAVAGFLPVVGPMLWPNGHPFFVVGMLYCLMRWVRDRSPHWFSAALLLAGLGMYVYFSLTPALAAMAVIALVFRRPLSGRSLAAVLVFLVLVWLPYLNFEAGRGFIDIGSMLLRRDLTAAEAQPAAAVSCYATLPGETDFQDWNYLPWTPTYDVNRMIYPGTGKLVVLALQACTLLNKMDRNFDSGYFLFGDPAGPTAALFGLYVTGWMILFFRSLSGWKRLAAWFERLRVVPAWKFLLWGGIGTAAIFLLVQPMVAGTLLAGDPDWNLPARLLLAQLRSYGIVVWISACLGLLLASRSDLLARDAGVLAIMIGTCGMLLWVLSEIERSWRFFWLWPLQTIAIVVVIGSLIRWWKPKPLITAGLIVLTIALFFPYRLDASRVNAIRQYGYGGRESGQMQAVEWIAGKAAQDPARTFVISVSRYGGGPDATRVWGWLEFGLKYLSVTPNAAVSYVSPEDDFRILEFTGADLDLHPQGCPWEGYDLVWESRRYAICQRRP
ncbi:MAG: glycosyltransferase family 39 protein [Anaerolineales bacterium]